MNFSNLFNFILVLNMAISAVQCTETLSLAAFNLKVFGDTKFTKYPLTTHVIVDETVRHDVMLLQEIRDKDASSMYGLYDKIKEVDSEYQMALSERLGRTSSKEQYAYLYRSSKLKLEESYVYDDEDLDLFEREPYIVLFSLIGTSFKFAMIGIHAKADSSMTFDEIQALYDVAENVKKDLGVQNVIILGDLNADCSYLSNTKKAKLALKQDPAYHWVIGDNEDTTVKESTHCAYDRIIYTGDALREGYERYGIVNLEEAYNIGEKEAGKISDHYPVFAVFNIN